MSVAPKPTSVFQTNVQVPENNVCGKHRVVMTDAPSEREIGMHCHKKEADLTKSRVSKRKLACPATRPVKTRYLSTIRLTSRMKHLGHEIKASSEKFESL
jgi:hypothetical protein